MAQFNGACLASFLVLARSSKIPRFLPALQNSIQATNEYYKMNLKLWHSHINRLVNLQTSFYSLHPIVEISVFCVIFPLLIVNIPRFRIALSAIYDTHNMRKEAKSPGSHRSPDKLPEDNLHHFWSKNCSFGSLNNVLYPNNMKTPYDTRRGQSNANNELVIIKT